MKEKIINVTGMMIVIIGLVFLSGGCEKDSSLSSDQNEIKDVAGTNITEPPCDGIVLANVAITPEEEEMLVFVREEEKLARDVYLMMYDQYNMQIFNKIAQSEQTHMDQVLCLLVHYGIEDPASSEIGVFNDPTLQNLYNEFIELGSSSKINALVAGASIEDLDIRDLEVFIAQTTNENIINVFGNLCCGSRNHMRAFSGQLAKRGVTYTPQYISQDYYDWIISTEKEDCGENTRATYRHQYRYEHNNGKG